MQLELGPTATLLQDGSASWDASAADAVAIWNGIWINHFSSVSGSTATRTSGDGKNSVFFSNTIFGESFGQDTLAVTVLLTPDGQGRKTSEADVVVNTAYRFDSYRGPLQTASGDLHRIFLHEFGHVLGLAHVTNHPGGKAIMEPIISDVDHPAADDILGLHRTYQA